MYNIIIYEDEKGYSDIKSFISELRKTSKNNKSDRINFEKVIAYIDLLEEMGTWIGEPVTKHLDGDIWELRPLSNRILFAIYDKDSYILLHHFVKKTNKTPKKEIDKAYRELYDFKRRDCKP